MKRLFLEDLKNYTEDEIKAHFTGEYEAKQEEVDKYDVLIAYESVGSWGCDSSSFFLLKNKETGGLFETHGSHCSCYGFEDQFEPESTTLEYLQSNNFYLSCGGYDSDEKENTRKVKEYINNVLAKTYC